METNKTVICFSPTGSCLKIARYLCSYGDVLIDVTLPLNRQTAPAFSKGGRAVFVFPVYNGNIPDVCARYIGILNGKGCRADIVCVYGGVTKGRSLPSAAKRLFDRGFVPTNGAYMAAPHFYAREKINILSDERLERLKNFLDGNFSVPRIGRAKICSPVSPQPLLKSLTGRCVTDFSVCEECGKCKEVCPVNAVNDDFTTKRNCLLCGACVNACPFNARKIKFLSPVPPLFVKLNCRHRDDEFFSFSGKKSIGG